MLTYVLRSEDMNRKMKLGFLLIFKQIFTKISEFSTLKFQVISDHAHSTLLLYYPFDVQGLNDTALVVPNYINAVEQTLDRTENDKIKN